jgi:hypothetical protein
VRSTQAVGVVSSLRARSEATVMKIAPERSITNMTTTPHDIAKGWPNRIEIRHLTAVLNPLTEPEDNGL